VAASARQIAAFLERVAAKEPTPGGGAVAASAGALATALASMVVAFSEGRKKGRHDEELAAQLESFARSRELLLELADADAQAYQRFADALKLDKSDESRAEAISSAAAAAVNIPQAVQATCMNLLRSLDRLASIGNPHLSSDLTAAAILAEAATRAAEQFVRANAPFLDDERRAISLVGEASRASRRAREMAERIETAQASG